MEVSVLQDALENFDVRADVAPEVARVGIAKKPAVQDEPGLFHVRRQVVLCEGHDLDQRRA